MKNVNRQNTPGVRAEKSIKGGEYTIEDGL